MATLYVVVLALNEHQRIAACVRSARFADKILLIDSGSTDGTVELARSLGAEVRVYDQWAGFGVQRQRALTHCADADYVFFLDADEEISDELRQDIQRAVASGQPAAWRALWNQVAFGTPLSGMHLPTSMPRLIHRPSLLRFEGAVHETAVLAEGTPVLMLRGALLHHSYDSVGRSLRKMTQYALLGAAKRAAQGKRGGVLRGLASASAVFVRLYLFKRGFLHGGAGFLFCYIQAQDAFFRYAALHYDRDQLSDDIRR